MKRVARGFTLVELMVTVAIMAILVSVGYPLYNAQLEKARRVDARGGLAKLAMAQERHYAMFGSYATSVAQLNYGPDATADGTNDTFAYREAVSDMDHNSDGNPDYYSIGLVANASSFTFTATAIGAQLSDEDCRKFTINQVGVKTAQDSGGGDQSSRCW